MKSYCREKTLTVVYLDAEQMLPIENGTKKAICVRIWRKVDFDRLIGFVHDRGYDSFISIVGC